MRLRLLFLPVLLAIFAGCSTFDQTELSQIRAHGVPPALMTRLEHNRSLTPPEVVTLSRLRVPDAYIVRYLHVNGVDSLVTSSDMKAMRQAGVSPLVRDATYAAGAEFAGIYGPPRYRVHYGVSIGDPYIDYPDYYGFEW